MNFVFVTILILFFSSFTSSSVAQNLKKRGKYLSFISKKQTKVVKHFLQYSSAIATDGKGKKTTYLRKKLLGEIQKAKLEISAMPAFIGDTKPKDSTVKNDSTGYRDSAVSFMNLYNNVIYADYNKVNTMKKAAGQSYHSMKIFLLAERTAFKKLEDANVKLDTISMKFAGKPVNKKYKMSKIMERVRNANTYYDSLYLIFFKNYREESDLLDAIDKRNVNDFKQHKDSLSKYSQAGLDQLDSLKPFKSDKSLIKNCKQILTLYVNEADKKIDKVADYFPEADDFQKTRAEFDKKPSHPDADIKAYKKSVKEFNHAIKGFSKTMHGIFKTRKHISNKWNSAANNFFLNHMPDCNYTR
jgi:hypothetical protein